MKHRVIVVGRGMIGSATGRHLADLTDGVALLGPSEPSDRASHDGVFASHYDEGRMTRIVDPDPAWSITAKRSIERYADLEARSGVRFFTDSGYLGFGDPGADYLERSADRGLEHEARTERMDAMAIRTRFPFLSVADEIQGLSERGTAGHISPRGIVRAHNEVARQLGASIIDDEATGLRFASSGVEVATRRGRSLHADRVLLAVGAYTDACGLLPVSLDLNVLGRTVLLARLDADIASELRGMPTLGHAESGAYILPPIRYPDGHDYVKIGIGSPDDESLRSRAALSRWFKGVGSRDDSDRLREFIVALIPALARCSHWHTSACAVTQTPNQIAVYRLRRERKSRRRNRRQREGREVLRRLGVAGRSSHDGRRLGPSRLTGSTAAARQRRSDRRLTRCPPGFIGRSSTRFGAPGGTRIPDHLVRSHTDEFNISTETVTCDACRICRTDANRWFLVSLDVAEAQTWQIYGRQAGYSRALAACSP